MLLDLERFKSAIAIMVICAVFSGCTSVAEIRKTHGKSPTAENKPTVSATNPKNPTLAEDNQLLNSASNLENCGRSAVTPKDRAFSIEDYGDFWAGFAEFDDQGWQYQSKKPSQIDAIRARLAADLANPKYDDADFLVIAFIHGWHHNAHDDDCNVHEFRSMLKLANERYKKDRSNNPSKRKRRVIGIYVGWRGESINVQGLNLSTVFDRSNAADRVAKGDVRGLFALIKKTQAVVQAKYTPAKPQTMRTIVIGHSFGGLIAFHSLAPAILGDLTIAKLDPEDCNTKASNTTDGGKAAANTSLPKSEQRAVNDSFPNMLVLINPAFEGTRFQSMHELNRPQGCPFPDAPPKIVVVTAENDLATGMFFVAERKVTTILEKYPAKPEEGSDIRYLDERESNSHAIGFIDRYRTHEMCLVSEGATKYRAAAFEYKPPPKKHPSDRDVMDWRNPDPHPAVWVVRAPKEIVNGHDGFLYASKVTDDGAQPSTQAQAPYLLDWLLSLENPSSPAVLVGAEEIKACKKFP